jgi:uncharacterized protein
MNCPICHIELKMSERQGIEIDYCPQCRGVWLDRGELDKIVERSQAPGVYQQSYEHKDEHRSNDPYKNNDPHRNNEPYRGYDEKYKKHKKKSFLEDIFDFD